MVRVKGEAGYGWVNPVCSSGCSDEGLSSHFSIIQKPIDGRLLAE